MKKHQQLAAFTAAWIVLCAVSLRSMLSVGDPLPILTTSVGMFLGDMLFLRLLPFLLAIFATTNLILNLIRLYCWIRYRTTELPDLPPKEQVRER